MIYGIIPARIESTRLPRKMLLSETDKPLIRHTYEAVKSATGIAGVVVATDSQEIAATVRAYGGRVVLTEKHDSGTSRIAEAAKSLPYATGVINIQGDEPDIDPEVIDRVARCLVLKSADIVTVSAPLRPGDIDNPNVVKVRMQPCGQPDFRRDRDPKYAWRHHVGIYGFSVEALSKAVALPPTELERDRRLEQLRWVDASFRWDVIHVNEPVFGGIDTAEDYAAFVERVRNG